MKIWKFNTIEVGFSSFFFPEEEDIDYFIKLSIEDNLLNKRL